MSDNGINPKVWGPTFWQTLHTCAATYPVNPSTIDKKQYFNYIVSFGNILPCSTCRDHFRKMLVDMNFGMNVLRSQESFFRFMFDIHNAVNKRIGKRVITDYSGVRRAYENMKSI